LTDDHHAEIVTTSQVGWARLWRSFHPRGIPTLAAMERVRDRKFADSPLERAGFELSVPGDGELCWGALTLGCIRGDRNAGAGTVQCDFFCSAGFENAQATRFFPAQHDVPTRQRSQQPTP